MKIYKLTYGHEEQGTIIGWHPNENAAQCEWEDANKKHGDVVTLYSITEYEVKPTQRDILRFLNHLTAGGLLCQLYGVTYRRPNRPIVDSVPMEIVRPTLVFTNRVGLLLSRGVHNHTKYFGH